MKKFNGKGEAYEGQQRAAVSFGARICINTLAGSSIIVLDEPVGISVLGLRMPCDVTSASPFRDAIPTVSHPDGQ